MATTQRPKHEGRNTYPKRAEIYLTSLDPTAGREIRKTRPALILQNDISNRHGATTVVAPITSTVRLPLSPVHVLLPAGPSTGLGAPSVAVFNQIRTVDRRRLIRKLGEADRWIMAQVDEAIQVSLGLAASRGGSEPSGANPYRRLR
jgi:mRNA interferase MazF